MIDSPPKLRDGKRVHSHEPYPLNEIPQDVIVRLCGHITFLTAVGRRDLTGDDFGDGFALAVAGRHLASPLGIADVVCDDEKICWSAKTVKVSDPWNVKNLRLISGRNSPDYSYGIEDPHRDIQKTGEAVLKIWNERINIAYGSYNLVRTIVLVRSHDLRRFTIFEENTSQVRPSDYEWKLTPKGNLIGVHRETRKTCFTWQPHGAQFTIHTTVPVSANRFEVKSPVKLDEKTFLLTLKYGKDWVHFLSRE